MYNTATYAPGGGNGGGGGPTTVHTLYPIYGNGSLANPVAIDQITEILYADLQALLYPVSALAIPGQKYLITDSQSADIGIEVEIKLDPVTGFTFLSNHATAGFFNPDYQIAGDYSGVPGFNAQRGVWNSGLILASGDVVIWNGLHYVNTTGTNPGTPDTNPGAFDVLTKGITTGYIQEWDVCEYDFANDWIQSRHDRRGNKIECSYLESTSEILAADPFAVFQWGNDIVYGNRAEGSVLDCINNTSSIFECSARQFSNVSLTLNTGVVHSLVVEAESTFLGVHNDGIVSGVIVSSFSIISANEFVGIIDYCECRSNSNIDITSSSALLSHVFVHDGSYLIATNMTGAMESFEISLIAIVDATANDEEVRQCIITQASTMDISANTGLINNCYAGGESDLIMTANSGPVAGIRVQESCTCNLSNNSGTVRNVFARDFSNVVLTNNTGTILDISTSNNSQLIGNDNAGDLFVISINSNRAISQSILNVLANTGSMNNILIDQGYIDASANSTVGGLQPVGAIVVRQGLLDISQNAGNVQNITLENATLNAATNAGEINNVRICNGAQMIADGNTVDGSLSLIEMSGEDTLIDAGTNQGLVSDIYMSGGSLLNVSANTGPVSNIVLRQASSLDLTNNNTEVTIVTISEESIGTFTNNVGQIKWLQVRTNSQYVGTDNQSPLNGVEVSLGSIVNGVTNSATVARVKVDTESTLGISTNQGNITDCSISDFSTLNASVNTSPILYCNISGNSSITATNNGGTVEQCMVSSFSGLDVSGNTGLVAGLTILSNGIISASSNAGIVSACTVIAAGLNASTQTSDGTIANCTVDSAASLDASTNEGNVIQCRFDTGNNSVVSRSAGWEIRCCRFSGNIGFIIPPAFTFTNDILEKGKSTFLGYVDITGQTDINITGNEYAGVIALLSVNALETISTITGMQNHFPVTFYKGDNDGTQVEFQSVTPGLATTDQICLEGNVNVTLTARNTAGMFALNDFIIIANEFAGVNVNRQLGGSVL